MRASRCGSRSMTATPEPSADATVAGDETVPCASRVSRALAPQATPAQRRGRHHRGQSSQHFPAISPVIRRMTEIIAFLALPQRGRAVFSYSFGSIQRGHGHPWRDGLGLDPGPQACNECPVMQTGPRLTRSQDIPDQVIDLPTVPGLFVTTDLPDDRGKALALQLPVGQRGYLLPKRESFLSHHFVTRLSSEPSSFTTVCHSGVPAWAEPGPISPREPGKSANGPCQSGKP
jgi:hypothetical protein